MALTRAETVGLECPHCHENKSKVIDTRGYAGKPGTWRRRTCLSCGRRFSSCETVVWLSLADEQKEER